MGVTIEIGGVLLKFMGLYYPVSNTLINDHD